PVRVVDAWLQDAAGARVDAVEHRAPLAFVMVVEALRELAAPVVGFQVLNRDGVAVLGFGGAMPAGRRVRVSARVENPLLPGRYSLGCSIGREDAPGDLALRVPQLVEFEVRPARTRRPGEDAELGMVSVDEDVHAALEAPRGA
ncbi:MAG TPA: Wzt carbohydrate-binding domain-containing protein, partial [Solirubrobacteraceae bacterium]|nr:Wzt carbohydrate-binding domain-containing protein [Solirubrobacteraceae bacterium]